MPEELASKIAAGEVIERPFSVVKELVENSLDANATKIVVRVVDGGKRLIIVEDDGEGMSFEDLKLSVLPRTTSKLLTVSDLIAIRSFGFRGEALYSIGSVSKLTITSFNGETGGTVKVFGGNIVESVLTLSGKIGTTVSVEDLFFNLPARRKFLKSSSAEFMRIYNLLLDVALPNYKTVFSLYNDVKLSFICGGVKSVAEVISQIWPQSVNSLESTENAIKDISASCFFIPKLASKLKLKTFVNKRVVKDSLLSSVVYDVIPKSEAGVLILMLEVSPFMVDVNVHPTKSEVRFKQPSLIYSFLKKLLESLFSKKTYCSIKNPFKTDKRFVIQKKDKAEDIDLFDYMLNKGDVGKDSLAVQESKKKLLNYEFVGVLKRGYWLFETDRGLIILDPHAAYERVLYNKLKDVISDKYTVKEPDIRQDLLIPLEVSISQGDQKIFLDFIKRLGFTVKLKEGSIFITAIPSWCEDLGLSSLDVKTLIFDAFFSDSEDLMLKDIDILLRRLSKKACSLSPKLKNALVSKEEAEALFLKLMEGQVPFICPHGRRTFFELSWKEVEEHFDRG